MLHSSLISRAIGGLLLVGSLLWTEAASALSISEIKFLTRGEAENRPSCVVTGVVVCTVGAHLSSYIVVDDKKPLAPGLYVNAEHLTGKKDLFQAEWPLSVGTRIVIEGYIQPYMLEPGITASQVTVLGKVKLPSPPAMRLSDMNGGQSNNQRVSFTGVLWRSRFERREPEGVTDTVLLVGTTHGVLKAHIAGQHRDFFDKRNAVISLKGTVLPIYNARAEFLTAELEVAEPSEIEILDEPREAEDVTGNPGGLLCWTPNQHPLKRLVSLDGEVVYVNRTEGFFVLQSGIGIRVDVDSGRLPECGEFIRVEGFPIMDEGCGILSSASVVSRLNSKQAAVHPTTMRPTLLKDLIEGDTWVTDVQYRFVTAKGRLLAVTETPQGGSRLILRIGDYPVEADLPESPETLPKSLDDRPLVTVRGVVRAPVDWQFSDGRGVRFKHISVLMRNQKDLEISYDAESRSRQGKRIGVRVGLCALIPLLGLVIFFVFRNWSRRQQDRMVALDRRRVANDLHDTVSQHLSGVRLLLFSVKSEFSALSPRAQTILKMAGEALESARHAVREAIVNLKDDRALTLPFPELLHESVQKICARANLELRVKLRGLPAHMKPDDKANILAIVQEAISNAVRHGGAKRIIIVSDPYGHNGFALSILNDGAPFDATQAPGAEAGHFGLSNMRERAGWAGGKVLFRQREGWSEVRFERVVH